MYASILDSVRALAKKLGADPNGEDIETVLNNISEAKGGKRTHKKSIAAAIDNITEVSEPAPKSENNAKFAATPAAFGLQSNLVSIDIPEGITSLGANAFANAEKLVNVNIPNSVTTIGSSAFVNCRALTNIELSNNVAIIGSNAFSSCTSLKTITINKSYASILGAPWGAPSTTQIIWNG